ncbi:hypothetical protein [Paremcibacter congregatus]|uniref:hypothetical protein n=1 Tax=Paremcibacter congregatus TaxID=2043170 RepID=UPI003A9291FD
MNDEGNPITRWAETVKQATDAASNFASDLRSQLDAIRVAGEKELDEFGAHNKLVCDDNDDLRDQIKSQAADISKLKDELAEARLLTADFRNECIDKAAEIERLRAALSKIMVVRKHPGKCKRLINGEILSEIELIAAQALKGGA